MCFPNARGASSAEPRALAEVGERRDGVQPGVQAHARGYKQTGGSVLDLLGYTSDRGGDDWGCQGLRQHDGRTLGGPGVRQEGHGRFGDCCHKLRRARGSAGPSRLVPPPRGRPCRPAPRANLARRVRPPAAPLSTPCRCGAGSRSSAPQARRSIPVQREPFRGVRAGQAARGEVEPRCRRGRYGGTPRRRRSGNPRSPSLRSAPTAANDRMAPGERRVTDASWATRTTGLPALRAARATCSSS